MIHPFLLTIATIPVPLRSLSATKISESRVQNGFVKARKGRTFIWHQEIPTPPSPWPVILAVLLIHFPSSSLCIEWFGQLSAPLVSGDCSYHRSVFSTGWPVDFMAPFIAAWSGFYDPVTGLVLVVGYLETREEKSKSGPFKTSTMSRLPRAKKWVSERIWDRVTFPGLENKMKRK